MDRLEELLVRSDEGALSPDEERELLELLKQSAPARRRLLAHGQLTNGIVRSLRRASALGAVQDLPRAPRARLLPWAAFVVSAGAVAAAIVLFVAGGPRQSGEGAHPAEASELGPVRPRVGRPPPRFVPPASEGAVAPAPEPAGDPATPPAPDSRTTLDLLRSLPREVVAGLRGERSDPRGYSRLNQPRFQCAAYQTPGLDTLVAGALLAREDWVKEGWTTVEATLSHQQKNGGFGGGEHCDVIWLALLPGALDALEQSPFAPVYAERIAAAHEAIRRAAGWLTAEQRPGQPRLAKLIPQFRIAAALAITAAAVRLDRPEMTRAAQTIADGEVARQREDGLFPGPYPRGCDVEFHVLQVRRALMLGTYLGNARYLQAARKGGTWLMEQLRTDRTGVEGDANPCALDSARRSRVRWALALHGARFEPAAFEVAQQLPPDDGQKPLPREGGDLKTHTPAEAFER